jgi:hypothetical protein
VLAIGRVLGALMLVYLIGLLAVVLLLDLAEKRESPAYAGLSRGALERT